MLGSIDGRSKEQSLPVFMVRSFGYTELFGEWKPELSRELVSLLFYLRIEISPNNPEVMDITMKHRLENMLGYLESESYLMAYRTLNAIVTESEASGELASLETSTALDVMQTCLRIIVGERVGHPEVAKHFAQTVSFYERLALLLTKKLLGDESAAAEVDILLFCHDALAKHRRN